MTPVLHEGTPQLDTLAELVELREQNRKLQAANLKLRLKHNELHGRIRTQRDLLRHEGVLPTSNDLVKLKARVNRLLMVVAHQRAQRHGKTDADDLADDLLHALERDAELYRRRWQRVLHAYLALRDVRELPETFGEVLRKLWAARRRQPRTPAIAALVEAEKRLLPNDLQVLT